MNVITRFAAIERVAAREDHVALRSESSRERRLRVFPHDVQVEDKLAACVDWWILKRFLKQRAKLCAFDKDRLADRYVVEERRVVETVCAADGQQACSGQVFEMIFRFDLCSYDAGAGQIFQLILKL